MAAPPGSAGPARRARRGAPRGHRPGPPGQGETRREERRAGALRGSARREETALAVTLGPARHVRTHTYRAWERLRECACAQAERRAHARTDTHGPSRISSLNSRRLSNSETRDPHGNCGANRGNGAVGAGNHPSERTGYLGWPRAVPPTCLCLRESGSGSAHLSGGRAGSRTVPVKIEPNLPGQGA